MRKLATIRKIDDIKAIPEADKICAYQVGGWWVVDTVGKYKINDLAVFCEVDSWMPTELAPFLTKGKEPREFEGVKGERLRTVKLRGQLSQGLLLPIPKDTLQGAGILIADGLDVTDHFGIKKWERPMNAQLAGMARGNFPTQIPKTDQERVQNMKKDVAAACEAGVQFEVTEKLEGSSMTNYLIDGVFGVCSRNLDLKETADNTFWQVARELDIEGKMRDCGTEGDWAIQGELIGPGIQDNIYKLSKPEFRVFDVYNIQAGEYLKPVYRRALIERMGLKHVPVLHESKPLHHGGDIGTILSWADGESEIGSNPLREGIVFKQVDGDMTFKAISNAYLLGEK